MNAYPWQVEEQKELIGPATTFQGKDVNEVLCGDTCVSSVIVCILIWLNIPVKEYKKQATIFILQKWQLYNELTVQLLVLTIIDDQTPKKAYFE